MTRMLTALLMFSLTSSIALADDGSSALACVIDEAENVFLVSSDTLSAIDSDGEVVDLVSFDATPTGIEIGTALEDDGTVPDACAAAAGIYWVAGEGVALVFDDEASASVFAGEAGVLEEVEEPRSFDVSMYDHSVVEDGFGRLFLSIDGAMFISKPHYYAKPLVYSTGEATTALGGSLNGIF